MEEIRKEETEKNNDNPDTPKGKQSFVNFKHRIRYFDWTIRLIRVFLWIQILWVVRKLFKNLLAVIKKWFLV